MELRRKLRRAVDQPFRLHRPTPTRPADSGHGRRRQALLASTLITTVDLSEEHAAIAAFAASEAVKRAMLWPDPKGSGSAERADSRQLRAVTTDGSQLCVPAHDLNDAVAAGRFRSRGGGYRHGGHRSCWCRQFWRSGASGVAPPSGRTQRARPGPECRWPSAAAIASATSRRAAGFRWRKLCLSSTPRRSPWVIRDPQHYG
jgi:hypothetical protein